MASSVTVRVEVPGLALSTSDSKYNATSDSKYVEGVRTRTVTYGLRKSFITPADLAVVGHPLCRTANGQLLRDGRLLRAVRWKPRFAAVAAAKSSGETAVTDEAGVALDSSSATNSADSEAVEPAAEPAFRSQAVEGILPELAGIYDKTRTWQWRGERINYVAVGEGPPILLIHGFGASLGHFRKNIPFLSQSHHRVYAVDLLGFGASAKPGNFLYSVELWADLILDFIAEVIREPVVVMGNSIGSLSVLLASANAAKGTIRGTVLLNCPGGMNNKAAADDWRIKLILPLILLLEFFLKQPAIASFIYKIVKNRLNVKTVLQSVYSNKTAVDEELLSLIMLPSDDEGALNVFVSVITGPPGPRPETLMPKITHPVLLLWGEEDPFTPLDSPISQYFKALPQKYDNTEFVVLPNVGHCPHDDEPSVVHSYLLPWIAKLAT